MPDLIKNIYNHESLRELALDIQSVYSAFQVDEFLKSTMDETWDDLELKDRIIQISINLGKYLPADYSAAISVIDKVVMNYGTWLDGFVSFFLIFVEIYRQDEVNWDVSMAALARYTQSSSAAVGAGINQIQKRPDAYPVYIGATKD